MILKLQPDAGPHPVQMFVVGKLVSCSVSPARFCLTKKIGWLKTCKEPGIIERAGLHPVQMFVMEYLCWGKSQMFVMGKLVSRPVPPGRCRSSRRYFSLRSKETICIKPKTIITFSLEWDSINFHFTHCQ